MMSRVQTRPRALTAPGRPSAAIRAAADASTAVYNTQSAVAQTPHRSLSAPPGGVTAIPEACASFAIILAPIPAGAGRAKGGGPAAVHLATLPIAGHAQQRHSHDPANRSAAQGASLTWPNAVGTRLLAPIIQYPAGVSMEHVTGLQQFLHILTQPDNIPIMGMMVLVLFFTYIGFKQARRNDQLIEQGKRDQIIEEMRK